MDYPAGSVKQNPVNGHVAVRTTSPDVEPCKPYAWHENSPTGMVPRSMDEVESWTDVELPHPAYGQVDG